ncbi:phage tail sheath C-terminal domain-containing protein [Desulfocurvus vexinensis]|uniref:phage tail sheath C-terminal domain-containing protein n=1 Tax=Desulfocurvus vexinensis TaxID=399548 RepID=UPI0004B228D0|nr:phage tail sheath C-terminal domain-containing protein [Desulfocurvus vexinensis]
MGTYLSPGIYTREVDFSFYVKQISTSSCGMVGVAERGPINKPVLVTSWEQFINKFGSYLQAGYLAYAARAFFDNGGSVLFVNRIAHLTDPTDRNTLTAVKAQVVLKDRRVATASLTSGTVGTDRIAWRAILPGAAGNAVSVELVAAGNDTPLSIGVLGQAVTVNLATDGAGDPVSTADQVVAAVVGSAEASALVTAETLDAGIVQAAASANLSGGMDAMDTLKVRAADEGTWGARLSVQVEDGSLDPSRAFNLVVRHKGEVVEVFKDLSMDEAAPNHVELAVNERSDFITVEDLGTASGLPSDRPLIGVFDLSGGDDGLTGLDDADYSGDPSQHTGFYAFDEIDALNLIMVPGVTTAEVIHAGVTYAENRQDLMLLAEAPIHLEPLEAVDFRKGQGMYSHGAFNSSYAALYYPWIEINDPVTGKRKLVPPSGAVAGCYARSDKKTHVWYAPAGIDRGRVFNALSLGYKTSRGERDVLYPEGVNVIASFPDSGINIWGQKTLQSQPSALDRVNVRRLMMFIEEAIAESSRFVVFEPNNPQTWRALIRLINPFMQDIKDKGGLYDFAVQCDEETNTPAVIDRNELVARVFVKPTKTAEFIELNFVLTATGSDFKEIFKTG